ncbi:hypothetical protein FHS85_003216 [Rhodoligotrophos appendicifer]|nr:hypothetical protein [Rhodoligotrophos appendicifer]
MELIDQGLSYMSEVNAFASSMPAWLQAIDSQAVGGGSIGGLQRD